MTCQRKRLPDRRRNITAAAVFERPGGAAMEFSISIGFADDLRLAEVFIETGQIWGSDMALIADDFAVLLSALLQRGASPQDLAHMLGRDDGRPATIAVRVADLLVEHKDLL